MVQRPHRPLAEKLGTAEESSLPDMCASFVVAKKYSVASPKQGQDIYAIIGSFMDINQYIASNCH